MYTLIFDHISEEALTYAKDNLDKVVYTKDITQEDYKKAEAVIVRIHKMDKDEIDKFANLKIIAKHGAGTDNIDKEYAKHKGIIVTNTPTANSNSVAELIVALALSASRKLVQSHFEVTKGVKTVSPENLTGFELIGKKLGLIGFGNIGSIVASILKNGFNMKVKVYDPFLSKEKIASLGYEKVETIDDILIDSDLVNISIPLTKDTENLISKRELNLMKEKAILINASRGKIINEDDLYLALKEKKIFGAALDAFSQEPVSKDIKLLECENFIASPHNGANTTDALNRMGRQAVDEILRLKKSEKNLNIVNK